MKNKKILTVFDDMIAHSVVTRNPEPKVIGMFLRSRTFLLFVLQNFIL